MELRDLEYFAAVAEELHFGRAAQRLHIVPASVSQRIRELERELGVTLFERTSRRVALTSAGETLLIQAHRVLSTADEFRGVASSLRTGRSGRVLVGFSPGSAHLIDALVRRLADERAGLSIVAESMWSVQALRELVHGDLDLAVVREPLPANGVDSILIASYRDNLVAIPSDSPHALHPEVSLSDFDGEGFLLNERDTAPGVHDATVGFFADHGVTPRWQLHRLHEQGQQLSLVAAGVGAALVHSHLAGITHPGVAIRPLIEEGPEHRFYLVWRYEDRSAAVQAVIGLDLLR